MKTAGLLLVAALALAACGGGNKVSRYNGGPSASLATGPISKACLRADRKAANARLCGCIQNVANQRLSSSDQNLAKGFFTDPHQAQVIRQSDNPRHESFWKRYKAFSARAESACRGL